MRQREREKERGKYFQRFNPRSHQQQVKRKADRRIWTQSLRELGECLIPSLRSLRQLHSPSSITLWQGIFPVTQVCFCTAKIACSNAHMPASLQIKEKKPLKRIWQSQSEAFSYFSCSCMATVFLLTRLNITSHCVAWMPTSFQSWVAEKQILQKYSYHFNILSKAADFSSFFFSRISCDSPAKKKSCG